jgi:phospholipase/lecithinase/hemolysin
MTGKRSLLAAAILMSISAAPAFAASRFDAIVSFGDSLSDVGNVFTATGGLQPASPYYQGRFSNGPNWLDDLAASLDLAPLEPSSLPGGTDYAWSGATTGLPASANTDGVPTLQQQIFLFNKANISQASPRALYTFSIGANDLFSLISQVGDGKISAAAAFNDAGEAAQIVGGAATKLQSEGATNLVLFDVPDLSKTPAMLEEGAAIEKLYGAAAEARFLGFVYDLTFSFDADVTTALRSAETAGLAVYDLNIFAKIDAIAADPGQYDFSDVTDPCYVGPFTGGGTVCGNPSGYLFWDVVHPTAAVGALIAGDALAKVVPEPSTWAMMAIGFAVLASAGLRARRRDAAA